MNHKSKLCREHCPRKSNKERVDCRVKEGACGWYEKTELAFSRGEYKIGEKKGHSWLIRSVISGWIASMLICYGYVLFATPEAQPHILKAYICFGICSAILCGAFITWMILGSKDKHTISTNKKSSAINKIE